MERDAFYVAAVGTSAEIEDSLRHVSMPKSLLLEAARAQNNGDVQGAKRILRNILRITDAAVLHAAAADFLGPILVMHGEMDEVLAVADILERERWVASAHAFRALAYADIGKRAAARQSVVLASDALDTESNEIIRLRVMQRLARAAFSLDEHENALDLALSSASVSSKLGAWRTAAAAYSICYAVHSNVTGDLHEAERYARAFHEVAQKSGDASIIHSATVVAYVFAVQIADTAQIEQLERVFETTAMPEQYAERFPRAFSYALVRGAEDLLTMQTLLHALRDLPSCSRGEWALCASLIAVSQAAQNDDDASRRNMNEAIARLGRPTGTEPAYERYSRRLARVSIAIARILVGDDALGMRTMDCVESRAGNGERLLPDLMRRGKLDEAPPLCRGIARVFANANRRRIAGRLPADLTPAEFDVLRLLANGWSAVRIAHETQRSVNTIYNHSRAILDKMQASRASEAVAIARARGLLS